MENNYCNYCQKTYSSYKSLWNHNKKFHPSELVNNTLTCKKCNTIFKSRQTKWRHEKNCDGTVLNDLSVLKNEIEELKKFIKTSNNVTIQNSNNTISNSNNTINNTMINNFNNDNLSFITPQFFKKLLKECLFEDDHSGLLPKVIEEVKFNKDHPENHNIKFLGDKSKYGEVFTDEGWKKVEDKVFVEYLTKRGYQIYKNLSMIHKDQIQGRYVESNENFKENYLNGKIDDETHKKMKETVISCAKRVSKQSRQEREEELSREIII